MYLKEIRTKGFKSFADDTNIEFEFNVNAIVGPNGSGKSNIVDAVRWALGEQSFKSLRGNDAMSDVIFSGSKTRKEAGSASVSLTFDNSDKFVKIENKEIFIKRKVYKDGTNEYYLNNQKCRLKDLTDFLLDSGIAKESFNIISQGKIEEIINNKPIEKRRIFEEAAGVLKYKRRKEEALRKVEKTNENIVRATDIINELENQVEPLRKEKARALLYQNVKKELEEKEVALITNDITVLNNKYQDNKKSMETLEKEILELSTNNVENEAEIEKNKLLISKINENIEEKQEKLMVLSSDLEKANSEKQIILEKEKYLVDDTKLHATLVEYKEKELSLSNQIVEVKKQIEGFNKKLSEVKSNSLFDQIKKVREEKEVKNNKLTNLLRQKSNLKIRIESLKDEIDNNLNIPYAVRSVLENIRLKGIKSTLGKVIEVEEKYVKAIDIALGYQANNVIVDDEETAKNAISYLKEKGSGRVTFYPLNVIKPKYIDEDTLKTINKEKGYINIASSLVKCEKLYENIVKHVLGNTIVVDDIDNANKISKIIQNRYKVVTLNGEVFNVGGSITGGNASSKNTISLKYDLEELLREEKKLLNQIEAIENSINESDYSLKGLEDKLYLINKDEILLQEHIKNKEETLRNLNKDLENISLSIKGSEVLLSNKISEEEEKIIKKYYEIEKEKNNVLSEIKELKSKKEFELDKLENYEHSLKSKNSLYNAKTREIRNLEIEVNRADVKLDMLLSTLNETYNLTYEKAKDDYILIDEEVTRLKVTDLKQELAELGIVNIGAIEEYDKISTRYEFLIHQKEDLTKALNTLFNIIDEMDSAMKIEFSKTFEVIRTNFKETFKELFRGGTADLKLTDPNDLLETGVEIVASPPGKKLSSISLLSGGEKTFTAISLLFAILKTKNTPFCILDEIEAALDDANVISFGKYLNKLKEKTQFILITHKQKTMEYVDVLYGITMQESGVSKLVSVKLENCRKE